MPALKEGLISSHVDEETLYKVQFVADAVTISAESTHDLTDMPSPLYMQKDKSLRELTGTWVMSKSLSVGIPKALEIQGYLSTTRKILLTSPLRLHITQSHYPSQLLVRTEVLRRSDTPSPSNSPSRGVNDMGTLPFTTTGRWYPPQRTGQWSEWSPGIFEVPIEGGLGDASGGGRMALKTRGRCRWVRGDDFEHKEGIGYLTDGLERLNEYFEAEIECPDGGWRSVHVWLVERGRLVKRVVTFDLAERKDIKPDGRVNLLGRRAETRWVFEREAR